MHRSHGPRSSAATAVPAAPPGLPSCVPRALRATAVPGKELGQTHGHGRATELSTAHPWAGSTEHGNRTQHTQPLHDSTVPTTPFGKIFIYNKSVPKRLVTKNYLLLHVWAVTMLLVEVNKLSLFTQCTKTKRHRNDSNRTQENTGTGKTKAKQRGLSRQRCHHHLPVQSSAPRRSHPQHSSELQDYAPGEESDAM